MESRHLLTFLTVVEAGSFTKAALKLGYAQSSITSQIQALETELEVPLFDRIGKKIKVTDAGRRLLPYAQEISKMHTLAKDALRSQEEISGTLTIGSPESLAAFRLPGIIREYRQNFPQVKIMLKPGLCWEMTSMVQNGELDLAFLLQPAEENKDLELEILVQEQMALVAPAGHPLADHGLVAPSDLKHETLLYTEPGCTYRTLFERQLNNQGVFPEQKLEFWSIEAIKQCVMAGLGLSLLPQISVHQELAEGKLVKLKWDDRPLRLSTQMVVHKKKWKSPALEAFLGIAKRHGAAWREEETYLD
ncbi:transcriptional regulator [Paenibacillus yonginensis]|uniref:Transcriptional regulator n=1 Tax=Paenibacillus yonginensis TaxID=1462996 RepID=A0A1B1N1G9_9BACL|nr:LysR family transcriptional regulator [Paenibacillus yonginensis]ANS75259.1 transcriptional regulator [Paenibacillus yonginensis]